MSTISGRDKCPRASAFSYGNPYNRSHYNRSASQFERQNLEKSSQIVETKNKEEYILAMPYDRMRTVKSCRRLASIAGTAAHSRQFCTLPRSFIYKTSSGDKTIKFRHTDIHAPRYFCARKVVLGKGAMNFGEAWPVFFF